MQENNHRLQERQEARRQVTPWRQEREDFFPPTPEEEQRDPDKREVAPRVSIMRPRDQIGKNFLTGGQEEGRRRQEKGARSRRKGVEPPQWYTDLAAIGQDS